MCFKVANTLHLIWQSYFTSKSKTSNTVHVSRIRHSFYIHEKWVKYELTVDEDKISPNKTENGKRKRSPQVKNDVKRIRLELIAKHSSVSVLGVSPLDCIRRKLNKYNTVIGIVEEPLIWWRKNQIQFPYLSRFAKVQLSFMATSALVERFFSKAGVLLTKRKANLDPVNMQKILFIHENFQLIKDYFGCLWHRD